MSRGKSRPTRFSDHIVEFDGVDVTSKLLILQYLSRIPENNVKKRQRAELIIAIRIKELFRLLEDIFGPDNVDVIEYYTNYPFKALETTWKIQLACLKFGKLCSLVCISADNSLMKVRKRQQASSELQNALQKLGQIGERLANLRLDCHGDVAQYAKQVDEVDIEIARLSKQMTGHADKGTNLGRKTKKQIEFLNVLILTGGKTYDLGESMKSNEKLKNVLLERAQEIPERLRVYDPDKLTHALFDEKNLRFSISQSQSI